jgi:hypothetical protein
MIEWKQEHANNKYAKWYENLIVKAQARTLPEGLYYESHHVIPRSFGGDNSKSNLANLTAREHYLAHAILWKMQFQGQFGHKMSYAFNTFMNQMGSKTGRKKVKINSKIYETFKIHFSKLMSAEMKGEKNRFYGKKHSTETKLKFAKYHNDPTVIEGKRVRVLGDKNPAKLPGVGKKISNTQLAKNAIDKINGTGLYSKACLDSRKISSGKERNGRAKVYILTDKEGNEFTVAGNLHGFCADNFIRYGRLLEVNKMATK